MITIVTGLGRCGSSMVMQMLDAAGISVVGAPPFYEVDKARLSSFDPAWLACQDGKVVKILALHRCKIPKKEYRVIYLYRDHKQQAQSQKKFYKLKFGKDSDKKAILSNVRRESKMCLKGAKIAGPVLSLKFEDFHNEQGLMKCIAEICQFLALDPDKVAVDMYNAVVKRPVECMPDMQVEEMIGETKV